MNKRSIIGVLVLAVGFLALAGALGYVETDGLWSTYWPVILIGIGLVNLVDNPRSYIMSGMVALVGIIFLLRNLGVPYLQELHFWEIFWPLVIIAAGLWLLSNKKVPIPRGGSSNSDDQLEAFALFSGSNPRSSSMNFKSADVFAMFGGVDLDLRQASVQEAPAKIDAFVMFGGVDIKVPDDWKVKVTGLPLFGGWGNKTLMKQTDKEVDCIVNCFVLFGGLDVKN